MWMIGRVSVGDMGDGVDVDVGASVGVDDVVDVGSTFDGDLSIGIMLRWRYNLLASISIVDVDDADHCGYADMGRTTFSCSVLITLGCDGLS